jgi:hypothetical protein
MVAMRGLVGVKIQTQAILSSQDVLRRPEELRRFENHLDDVSVAVILRSDLRVNVKKEDVHAHVGLISSVVGRHIFIWPSLSKDDGSFPVITCVLQPPGGVHTLAEVGDSAGFNGFVSDLG